MPRRAFSRCAAISDKTEQWRVGDTANIADTTTCAYSTVATGINDTTAAAMWIDQMLR